MTPEERLAARIVVLTDLDTGPGGYLELDIIHICFSGTLRIENASAGRNPAELIEYVP